MSYERTNKLYVGIAACLFDLYVCIFTTVELSNSAWGIFSFFICYAREWECVKIDKDSRAVTATHSLSLSHTQTHTLSICTVHTDKYSSIQPHYCIMNWQQTTTTGTHFLPSREHLHTSNSSTRTKHTHTHCLPRSDALSLAHVHIHRYAFVQFRK